MKEELFWIWINRIPDLGCKRIKNLLQRYKTIEKILNLSKKELMEVQGIGEVVANEILKQEYRENLEKYLNYMKQNKIGMITIMDKDYPESLKKLYDSPITLFYKGNKQLLKKKSIAIVGCRQCSEYGKKVSFGFSYELAKHGQVIVSGMARGIDAYAHRGCLNANGKTIAVLGSGVDQVYPKENLGLYEEIIKSEGLILSEYIIGTKPNKMNFPARNRIISTLAESLLVVEAKKKSGTLITVDFALEQGKEIFVIPGNITSENSNGTNELIKQGANLATSVEDILHDIN